MELGIFTHYLPGTVEETARKAKTLGFDCVQLNLEFTDWRFEPGVTTADECRRVRDTFHRHGLSIAAIAGYVNLVAPDLARRRRNIERLNAILRVAHDLGSPYVTTETGTFHPDDDWAPHPQNETPRAIDLLWNTLYEDIIEIARDHNASVVLELSVGNIVDTVAKLHQLVDKFYINDSELLGFVADPANYVDGTNIDRAAEILQGVYTDGYLAMDTCIAHAKDFRRIDRERRENHHHLSDPALYGGVEYPAPGLGNLDYDAYLKWLLAMDRPPPLIIEHVAETDIPRAKAFIESKLAALNR